MSEVHALVTGASAGIGAEYVRQLAERCTRITIVARRLERLDTLASELAGDCVIEPLQANLGTVEGQTRVVEAIRQGPALDYLVNNAGFSTLGPFAQSVLDQELDMVRLHVDATLALTRAALPAMLERGSGAIINLGSIGGLLKMPGVAVYGATKAFLVSFCRSLQSEVGEAGVKVQCLCPGYTRTEIHSRDSFAGFDTSRVPEELWMESDVVVAESLAALDNDEWLVVPGERNREMANVGMQDLMLSGAGM